VSMNGVPVRILLVGEATDACRLRGLLGTGESSSFHIAHVGDLDLAAERLSNDPADVLLLDLGFRQPQGRAYVQAARAVAHPVRNVRPQSSSGLAWRAGSRGGRGNTPHQGLQARR